MIALRNVTKSYPGGHLGLAAVSITIDRGDFVVITGASGAGKSTLLNAITFRLRPDEGEVMVGKYSSLRLRRRDIPRIRRQFGIITQDLRLLDDRSIYENVAFALRITGTHDPRAVKHGTMRALHRVGLAHRLHSRPRELSGGEQQRAALARALVNDPVFLLADEPAGNLDARAGDQIFALLREVNLGGTGVLLATHNPGGIDSRRDRIVRMENGVLHEWVPAAGSGTAGTAGAAGGSWQKAQP
jgi:cell division transport system ATP-binding protein